MSQSPEQASVKRSGTAAIIGRTNVGKSTFLNAALQQDLAIVAPTPQTTRDSILAVLHVGNAQIALLDTPGLHRAQSKLGRQLNAMARDAAAGADVVVFITSLAPKPQPPLVPHPGDLELLKSLGTDRPIVLVINKIDLLKSKVDLFPLLEAFGALGELAAIVPISARRKDGVQRVLNEVGQLLPTRGPAYDDDFLTDRPLRFFAAEYVREQVIMATREEVPHHVAVTIERFDESGPTVHIDATIYCARAGQRGIIIGAGAERLKLIGTHARKRIEELLERKVNLKLHVDVQEGWMDSRQALGSFGYLASGSAKDKS